MKSLPIIAAIASLGLAATACDRSPVEIEDHPAEPTLPPPPQTRAITMMTRNLYLGADLTPVMNAASPQEIPGAVGEAWNRIVLNDFPARADAIAREIQSTRPDVVGLQEVAKFRIQSPGDFLVGNPQAATAVEYDYLLLLLDALEARGLRYTIASVRLPGGVGILQVHETRAAANKVISGGPQDRHGRESTESTSAKWLRCPSATGRPRPQACRPQGRWRRLAHPWWRCRYGIYGPPCRRPATWPRRPSSRLS